MNILKHESDWSLVRQLEKNDVAMAGPDGILNDQAKALLNRTEFIKEKVFNDSMTGVAADKVFFGDLNLEEIDEKKIEFLDSIDQLMIMENLKDRKVCLVINDGYYQYLNGSWVKVNRSNPEDIVVDQTANENQKTLNEYFLKSIFELKEKIIDLENDAEDFSTLESRLIESLIKIDLPMVYSGSIAMSFDSVPSYESKTAVSGTVSGVVFADYQVELYVVTSKKYYWKTADIDANGHWSFTNSNTGTKQVRLVRKSDNVWIHTLEIPTCVRSHRMTPDTDPATAAIMSDRTYTYDQAIVACAMIAQNHPNVNHYIKGLLAVIGADGSVPFYVNRLSAFKSRNYYRSGNAAWVYYALTYYLKKYPNGTYAVQAMEKLQLGLSWMERYFISNISDPRYGLYSGGSGRFIDGGTIFEESYEVYWCSCEHNLDMWFVLNGAVKLGLTTYTDRRDIIKSTIVSKLWDPISKRLYTGINEFGLDKTNYLDTSSWGGLFLLASGDTVKGSLSKEYLETYKFPTIEASGYTPYLEQNKTKGIWVEGSAGVALYERALGNIANNQNIISKMRALLTPYGYRDSLIDPNDKTLSLWEQSCNTAWILLAYKPNGFMEVV